MQGLPEERTTAVYLVKKKSHHQADPQSLTHKIDQGQQQICIDLAQKIMLVKKTLSTSRKLAMLRVKEALQRTINSKMRAISTLRPKKP